MILRTAVHYHQPHPEVVAHLLARVDASERHLRTLIAMGLSVFAHRMGTGDVERWEAEASAEIPPLSLDWLGDLLALSLWDAEQTKSGSE